MKISELNVGQSKVDVEAEVKSIEEPRSFNKFGRSIRVANAVVTDGSGEIKLTLWNDDIDKVKVGSKIKITNGFVNEFQGEKQLTSGKFGKLEILEGKGEGKSEKAEKEEDKKPARKSSKKAEGKDGKEVVEDIKEKVEEVVDEELGDVKEEIEDY